MTKQEEKQIYEVLVLRNDGQHMVAKSSDNYDTCFEAWKSLVAKWENAITNKIPLSIVEPVVTAFDPGLIKEILLRPLMKVPESRYDNPYQKEMMNKGLSGVLKPGNVLNPDIMDEGYR